MKKYLPEDSSPPSTTLIAVHPKRLREEYEAGRHDEAKAEFSRKFNRIVVSTTVTLLSFLSMGLGVSANTLIWLLPLQVLLHILL